MPKFAPKLNKSHQKTLDRVWTLMVNGGIPLNGGFEINVVRAHVEKAFEAGVRAERRRNAEKER
jgi:hypothetical protein